MSSQVLSLILFCTQISNNLASTGGPHEISRRAVVCRLPPPGQTKESARRDGGAAACLLCTTICFYCMALDHMFLLYGPKTYVPKTYVPKTYVPKTYVPKHMFQMQMAPLTMEGTCWRYINSSNKLYWS